MIALSSSTTSIDNWLNPVPIFPSRIMGSAGSKAAKTAASSAKRQYPTLIPQQPPPSQRATSPGPTVHPKARASTTRDEGATYHIHVMSLAHILL